MSTQTQARRPRRTVGRQHELDFPAVPPVTPQSWTRVWSRRKTADGSMPHLPGLPDRQEHRLEPFLCVLQVFGVLTVPWRESQVVLEGERRPRCFVGAEEGLHLSQEIKRLPVCKTVRVARCMSIACRTLVCDLPASSTLSHKIQHAALGACDADNETPIFVAVFMAERNRAFAIDQAGDVRGIARIEGGHCAIARHRFSIVENAAKKTPPGCPGGA